MRSSTLSLTRVALSPSPQPSPNPSPTFHSPKKGRRGPQRRFRELCARCAMYCGLPLARSWRDAGVMGIAQLQSVPVAPLNWRRYVSRRVYIRRHACVSVLFMNNHHSSTTHRTRYGDVSGFRRIDGRACAGGRCGPHVVVRRAMRDQGLGPPHTSGTPHGTGAQGLLLAIIGSTIFMLAFFEKLLGTVSADQNKFG